MTPVIDMSSLSTDCMLSGMVVPVQEQLCETLRAAAQRVQSNFSPFSSPTGMPFVLTSNQTL